jgi:hypothetical protein
VWSTERPGFFLAGKSASVHALATRTRDNRRAKVLKLTPEGRRVVEATFSRHAAELEAAMVVLNASEKRQLHGMLKKLGLFAAGASAEASREKENSK